MPQNPRALVAYIPEILRRGDAVKAFQWATRLRPATHLPEIMTLFATRNLTAPQHQVMTARVYAPPAHQDPGALARLSGHLGRWGFSFPQWRFLSQNFNGAALIERFGMTRLTRANDVRDAQLPKTDPTRDLFGPGFAITTAHHYIEYRRAYILCSSLDAAAPMTLAIRNNAYVFGRDRLPHAVYVSTAPHSIEQLQAFDGRQKDFIDWQRFVADPAITKQQMGQVGALLQALDDFDHGLSRWLLGAGARDLRDYLHQPRKATLYLAALDPTRPPWFPAASVAVTPGNIQYLEPQRLAVRLEQDGHKLALLSGPCGDFPCKPRGY